LLVPFGLAACGSQPDNASEGVTVDLSAAEPGNAANAVAPVQNLMTVSAPTPPAPAAEPVEKEPPRPKPSARESPPEAEEPPEPAAEEPPADEAAAATDSDSAASEPPISNALIARTLRRIGFSCGQVTSTERVLTDSGSVFRINCSNGQSYRGSTVRGRMRFRRWTGE
jgi:hypothetical protein